MWCKHTHIHTHIHTHTRVYTLVSATELDDGISMGGDRRTGREAGSSSVDPLFCSSWVCKEREGERERERDSSMQAGSVSGERAGADRWAGGS